MAKTKKLIESYQKIEQQQKIIMQLQLNLIKTLSENKTLRYEMQAVKTFVTKN